MWGISQALSTHCLCAPIPLSPFLRCVDSPELAKKMLEQLILATF